MAFAELPVCVLSFDRPGYLRRTLATLAAARAAAGHAGPVALLQDGAVNPHSGQRKAPDEDIAACIAVFRDIFPAGEVLQAGENIGIGRNMARAEHWALGELAAPAALIFEDDLALAPHYFRAMAGLYELARAQPRIAMFSAYGVNFLTPRDTQQARRRAVGAMHHNWGFGLMRAAWTERRALTDAFDALLAGCDYRDRPLDRIVAWYAALGWPPLPTSQDIARATALNTLGYARVASVAVGARYIGEVGQHYTPEEFRRMRFADAVLAEGGGEAWDFDPPDQPQLDAIVAAQRAEILSQRLDAAAVLHHPGVAEAIRLAQAFGAAPVRASPLVAVAGLHADRACGPLARFVLPPAPPPRRLTLRGLAGAHLPPGTTLSLTLNGRVQATVTLRPGAPFAQELDVPAALDGLEVVLTARCSVAADGFSARVSQDRRALAFHFDRLDIAYADGAAPQSLTGAALAAAL